MKISRRIWIVLVLLGMGLGMSAISSGAPAMKRILVVSSYHRDYLWSQATQRGVSEAMLKYGYLDNTQQIATLATQDYIESDKAVIKKLWMDTKRKYSCKRWPGKAPYPCN